MPSPKYRFEFDAIVIVEGDNIVEAEKEAEAAFPEDGKGTPRAQFIGADSRATVLTLDEAGETEDQLGPDEVDDLEQLHLMLATPELELHRIARALADENGDDDGRVRFLRALAETRTSH